MSKSGRPYPCQNCSRWLPHPPGRKDSKRIFAESFVMSPPPPGWPNRSRNWSELKVFHGPPRRGRGNAGRTPSKSGHPCPCQNYSWWPPAEKSGRGSLLNRPSCSHDDPVDQRTEVNWRFPTVQPDRKALNSALSSRNQSQTHLLCNTNQPMSGLKLSSLFHITLCMLPSIPLCMHFTYLFACILLIKLTSSPYMSLYASVVIYLTYLFVCTVHVSLHVFYISLCMYFTCLIARTLYVPLCMLLYMPLYMHFTYLFPCFYAF